MPLRLRFSGMAHRRQFVSTLAAGVATGALAGCGGAGGAETTSQYPEYTDLPDEVTEFLSNTSNFDGTGIDRTDADAVSVTVGAEGNDNYWAYEPVVVAIRPDTTVRWEWNGKGGAHNVVSAEDRDPLDSGAAVPSDDATYEYTFEESGVYRYVCVPHRASGMKGVVVVE